MYNTHTHITMVSSRTARYTEQCYHVGQEDTQHNDTMANSQVLLNCKNRQILHKKHLIKTTNLLIMMNTKNIYLVKYLLILRFQVWLRLRLVPSFHWRFHHRFYNKCDQRYWNYLDHKQRQNTDELSYY